MLVTLQAICLELTEKELEYRIRNSNDHANCFKKNFVEVKNWDFARI